MKTWANNWIFVATTGSPNDQEWCKKRFSPPTAEQWEKWIGHVHRLTKEEENKLSCYLLSMTVRIRARNPVGNHKVMIRDSELASGYVYLLSESQNSPIPPPTRLCPTSACIYFSHEPVSELTMNTGSFQFQQKNIFRNFELLSPICFLYTLHH